MNHLRGNSLFQDGLGCDTWPHAVGKTIRKYLQVTVHSELGAKVPDVARLVREFPAKRELWEQGELVQGLGVRVAVQCKLSSAPAGSPVGAAAELQLGEDARFYPSDVALAGWRAQAGQGRAEIAYE